MQVLSAGKKEIEKMFIDPELEGISELKFKIEMLHLNTQPHWQEKAMQIIRQSRRDDPAKELKRLRHLDRLFFGKAAYFWLH